MYWWACASAAADLMATFLCADSHFGDTIQSDRMAVRRGCPVSDRSSQCRARMHRASFKNRSRVSRSFGLRTFAPPACSHFSQAFCVLFGIHRLPLGIFLGRRDSWKHLPSCKQRAYFNLA